MNIDLDKQSSTRALIKITLNKSDYQPEVEKKLKTYGKQVQLKGFRPGKVPIALVKKMYGKGVLLEEINRMVSNSLFSYIRDEEVPVVGDPTPLDTNTFEDLDINNPGDFEFSFEVGTAGEFDYNLEEMSFKSYKIIPGEKEVEEVVENIRKNYGDTEHPEVSEAGDFIKGELKPKAEGEEETPEASEESGEEDEEENKSDFPKSVLLPLNQLSEDVLDQFIGLKAEDEVTFDIQKLFKTGAKGLSLATSIPEEDAAKIEGEFSFSVEGITRTKLAEMNEELFEKVNPEAEEQSEEAFLEKVKERISENYDAQSNDFLDGQIYDYFMDNVAIELPDEYLKEWLKKQEGNDFDEGDVDKQYPDFAKNLRWDLISNRLINESDVEVSYEEVKAEAQKMVLGQFGFQGGVPDNPELANQLNAVVDQYLQAEEGKNYQRIYAQVRRQKAFDVVKEKATLEETEISRDEFEKIIEEFNEKFRAKSEASEA